MWKEMTFLGVVLIGLALLTMGTMEFYGKFGVDNSPVYQSYNKQKSSQFGFTHDWVRR